MPILGTLGGIPPVQDQPVAPRARGIGHRFTWTFADQALSSLSNAGLSILVARSVSATDFGSFGVALLAFTFVIGLNRALVTDPLVVLWSASSVKALKRGAADAAGAALVVGLFASLACASAAAVLNDQTGAALAALAVVLPFILIQDCWRYAFFAGDRPAAATCNDLVWTVLQFGAVGALIATGHDDVPLLVLAWGGAASVASLVGAAQLGVLPRPQAALSWFRKHRTLAGRLGADYVINTSAVNISMALVGSLLGVAAVGALRAGQVLLGPLGLLQGGFTSFVLPLLSRRVAAGAPILPAAAATSVAVSNLALVWVALLLMLPRGLGEALLGDSWSGARQVVPALGVMMVVISAAMGASLGMKAAGRSGLLLRVTLVQAPAIVLATWAGILTNGVTGAAVGLAMAHVLGLVLSWISCRSLRNTGNQRLIET